MCHTLEASSGLAEGQVSPQPVGWCSQRLCGLLLPEMGWLGYCCSGWNDQLEHVHARQWQTHKACSGAHLMPRVRKLSCPLHHDMDLGCETNGHRLRLRVVGQPSPLALLRLSPSWCAHAGDACEWIGVAGQSQKGQNGVMLGLFSSWHQATSASVNKVLRIDSDTQRLLGGSWVASK